MKQTTNIVLAQGPYDKKFDYDKSFYCLKKDSNNQKFIRTHFIYFEGLIYTFSEHFTFRQRDRDVGGEGSPLSYTSYDRPCSYCGTYYSQFRREASLFINYENRAFRFFTPVLMICDSCQAHNCNNGELFSFTEDYNTYYGVLVKQTITEIEMQKISENCKKTFYELYDENQWEDINNSLKT